VIGEIISSSPAIVEDELPEGRDKDPAWRATAIFTREETERLISDERIAEDRRAQYGLLFLAGLRLGEAIALRWRDYDPKTRPLGCLDVSRSYCRVLHREKETKTGVPRQVPVHSELAKILAEWKLGGYERFCGRIPQPDDLILPTTKGTTHRDTSASWKLMQSDLDTLGLRHRRQHDTRRTFISLAIADGAQPHILKWVTHGCKKSIMDQYTTLPWVTRCEAVACLQIARREGLLIQLPKVALGTTLAPPADIAAMIDISPCINR
jgi:integrase